MRNSKNNNFGFGRTAVVHHFVLSLVLACSFWSGTGMTVVRANPLDDSSLSDIDFTSGDNAIENVNGAVGGVDQILASLWAGFNDRKTALDRLFDVLGGDWTWESVDDLEDLIGKIGIPILDQTMEQLWEDLFAEGALEGDKDEQTPETDPINDLNPSLLIRTRSAQVEVETARLESERVLSEENQEAIAQEMARIQDLAISAYDLAEGNATLSQTAYSAFGASSEAMGASVETAAASQELSTNAQDAVSTQDVVKNLTAVAGNLSEQMASGSEQLSLLADQGSVSSSQFANISQQLANQSQIDAATLNRISQMALGISVIQRNISGLQEVEEGAKQRDDIERSIRNNSTNVLASQSLQLFE